MVLYISTKPRSKRLSRKRYTKVKFQKKTVIPNKNQAIVSLNKQVRSLRRQVNFDKKTVYTANYSNQSVTGDYNQYNLSLISGTTLLYGRTADDIQDNRATLNSITLTGTVSMNTEGNPINFTMFIVSLKKNAPDGIFDSGTGFLSLLPNTHYYSANGKTFLNPEIFNIHKTKRWMFTNNNQIPDHPSGNTMPSHKQFKYTLYPKKRLIATTNWYNMISPNDTSANYFLLLFNDNLPTDLESPYMELTNMNVYRTG